MTGFGNPPIGIATPNSFARTQPQGSLFQTQQPATASAPSMFGGFGNPTTSSVTFGAVPTSVPSQFGQPQQQPMFNFAAAASQPSLFSSAAKATQPSLFGGASLTTSSAPFQFAGGTTTTQSAFSFPQTSTTPFGLSTVGPATSFQVGQPGVTAPLPSLGLGGVDTSQATLGGLISGVNIPVTGTSDTKGAKESTIPNEIQVQIDSFKEYTKKEKMTRERIAQASSKDIEKVEKEVARLMQFLSSICSSIQRNSVVIDKLKIESAQDLKDAEILQRTRDLPAALQYDNSSPTAYFNRIANQFEHQMQMYRKEIEELDKHLNSATKSSVLTPQELNLALRQLHEIFVSLAAQLHSVHDSVQKVKDEFLLLCKAVHGEIPAYLELTRTTKVYTTEASSSMSFTGPSPFSNLPTAAAIAMASAQSRKQGQAATSILGTSPTGTSPPLYGSSFSSSLGAGNTSFGGGSFFSPNAGAFSPLNMQNKTFQLAKPPVGNKRGKRGTSS